MSETDSSPAQFDPDSSVSTRSALRNVAARLGALAACAALALGYGADPALADKRVALLIGNAAYSATAALQNPINDVELMGRAFANAGFDSVDIVTDADRGEMITALRNFEDKATGSDIAVIYYSGHGMEMAGQNYLIPVDARLKTDRDVVDEAVTLERAQLALEGVKKLRVVILDACRNNPFETTMKRSYSLKAVTRGLSRVEPGINTLIGFAAKAGTVADDGAGPSSPYAAALANRLVQPGVDVQIAFRQVRDDVLEATGQNQEPFVYGSLGGLALPLSKHTPAPLGMASDPDDDVVWEAVKAAGDAQLVRDFILRYPRNRNREDAIKLLTELQQPIPAPALREPVASTNAAATPLPLASPQPATTEKAPETPSTTAAIAPVPLPTAPPVVETQPKAASPDAKAGDEPRTMKRKKPKTVAAPPARAAPAARATVRRVGAEPQREAPRRSSFFGCRLPLKNPVNSSYYGEGAAVIRCVK
jgi:uncharacterized protein